jgi:hypothetical protein
VQDEIKLKKEIFLSKTFEDICEKLLLVICTENEDSAYYVRK